MPRTELMVRMTSMLFEFLGSISRIFFRGAGIPLNFEIRVFKAVSSSWVGSL